MRLSALLFFFAVLVFPVCALGQRNYIENGWCCDPSAGGDYDGIFICLTLPDEGSENPVDANVCDPDCITYPVGDCTPIPIDGGLGLLALAGGGLATAAMRRRREVEVVREKA